MKKLSSFLTGGFMLLATQLSAQEAPDNSIENIPESKQDIILRSYNLTIIRVISDDETNSNVNNIVVMCPIMPLTKIFSENGAVVIAGHATAKEMAEALKKQEETRKAIVENGRGDQGIPFINFSFVDTDNKVRPLYTFNQIINMVDNLNRGTLNDAGSALKGNQTLINNIAKHAEEFCMSGM